MASIESAPGQSTPALAAGQRLEGGARVALTSEQSVSLDIAQSGRLDVHGDALLRIGLDAEAQVLAARGLFTVNMPPTGDGKLLTMRLATPRLTLTLRPGTVAVVAIGKTHDVLVHVLSGEAEIAPALLDAETGSEPERINPGAAKRFDARGSTALKPAEDVSAALAKATAFLKAASRARAASGADALGANAAVESALARLDEETARGRELSRQQQAAVAAGDKATRQARQRELAQHGQRLFRIRRVLLALWERAQLGELARSPEVQAQGSEAHQQLRARLVPVLPR